ncbi:MAG: tRNA (adenosine(37)-N6)-dimethylallyltransferase MiaA [Clostridiales bacterium]|nr:tRNA (adenosine(37)-N6)-dimethylallyltransferase MiaA [Clostridiales bacterium]
MTDNRPKLIIIAGPTAVGKTSAAVRLCEEIGGEVISADSMQVYRGMDIGTAKVREDEMHGIRHHLIDILDPDTEFSAADFKELSLKACSEIYKRGHIPVVCGGTGFYIQGLLYDIDFSEEERDCSYRDQLSEIFSSEGIDALADMLRQIDPEACEKIDMHNSRRIIRALEFYKNHGFSIVRHNEKEEKKRGSSPFDCSFFVLTSERQVLYERINRRVDMMMEEGLLEEARLLKQTVSHLSSTAGQAIGYKELFEYLDGICTLNTAVEKIKINSRHYAKRQLTWFRREKNAVWIDVQKGDPLDDIRKHIQELWNM